jgi:hypothetical protein
MPSNIPGDPSDYRGEEVQPTHSPQMEQSRNIDQSQDGGQRPSRPTRTRFALSTEKGVSTAPEIWSRGSSIRRCRITASGRASATIAFFIPRRLARRDDRRSKKRRRQSSRRHRCMLPARLFSPGRFVGASVPPLANASCTPHRAPADLPANLAFRGSGHANTINSRPTYSTSEGDLRGHGVCLMKQRWRHGLRRRCDGQGKGGNNDQPDHWFPPCFSFKDQSCLVSAGKL